MRLISSSLMLYLTSTTTGAIHRAMIANQQHFGRFYTPKNRDGKEDLGLWENWILDNGAFTGYDQDSFFIYLERLLPHKDTCRMVIVPDIPFKWEETWEKYLGWHSAIANMGFKRGLAVQDGATVDNIDWSIVDGLFIGGSTEWKRNDQYNSLPMFRQLALHPRDKIIQEAKRRNLWIHIGRQANSQKQLWNAFYMGADSVDGTGLNKAPRQGFNWVAQTIWEINCIGTSINGAKWKYD